MTIGNARIKTSIAAVLIWTACAGAAHAQTPASESMGYAEVVAQSAFGNVTSQSFGGEFGFAIRPQLQIFVDVGKIRDAAPTSLGDAAQRVAIGIAAAAGSADFTVKQPVTFGVAGIKYLLPVTSEKALPYVLAGGGVASVSKDVTFSTPNGSVSQFATIGSDLSGSETKGMLSVGVGVDVPVWQRLIIDLQYRYGRVFTSDGGLNTNRAGIGVGVRF